MEKKVSRVREYRDIFSEGKQVNFSAVTFFM